MITDGRVLAWFSCGAASAVAAKLTVAKYPWTQILYCNTLTTEHPDNLRFMRDVSQWIGRDITVIASNKYTSVDQVFEETRWMAGPFGARCTMEMKKIPRYDFQQPNDLHVFGLTADEGKRIRDFNINNADLELEWILQENNVTKEDCYQAIRDAGIEMPAMYKLGFRNNNCIGCVKSTSPAYWNRTREHFPTVWERRVAQSRSLNVRLVQIYKKKRIFLDELPIDYKGGKPEESVDCGVICSH